MEEEKEEWRNVVGSDGTYIVSNLGRIKSFRFGKWKVLDGHVNKNGYTDFNIKKNDSYKVMKLHIMVAESFLGHTSKGSKIVVDHISGNKLDNRLINLRIVTGRENTTTCFRKNFNKFSSKYVGVSWNKDRGKWWSYIRIGSKNKFLGYFKYEIDASNAYQKALKLIT